MDCYQSWVSEDPSDGQIVCEEGIRLMGQLQSRAQSFYGGRGEEASESEWESGSIYGSGSDMGSTSSKASEIEEKDKPIIMVLGM